MAEKRGCYFASECAELLGMSTEHFYRQREVLHSRGMPSSIGPGRVRIPRVLFDAWLEARLPPARPSGYKTDEEHLAAFQREYRIR